MSSIRDTEISQSGDRAHPYLQKGYIDTLAHDLRSPLVSGVQILELILTGAVGPLQDDANRLLGLLQDEQQKALQMVTSLIEIYRLETGTAQLTIAPANISEILASAIFACKKECEKKKITTETKCDEAFQSLVDLKYTTRAMNLLMTNCLAHTEPGSTIKTEITKQNSDCTIKLVFTSFNARAETEQVFKDYDPNYSYKILMPPARLDLRLCSDILAHQNGRIRFDGDGPNHLSIALSFPIA